MALVSFFRNPVLAKVVGAIAAVAFLLPLVRYRGAFRFIFYAALTVALIALARSYVLRRRKRLTPPEEKYLQDRFYEQ
jgi:membrane protein implicated in regulation of membrane protease activity